MTTNPPVRCYHCGRPALFLWDGKIPLCLDCDLKVQQIHQRQLDELERAHNYLVNLMDYTVGFPSGAPRFPTRQAIQIRGGVTLNNIRIDNSTIGVLNTGNLQMVDSAVTILKSTGEEQLSQSITRLTEAVAKSPELSAEDKKEIIEHLSILATEATLPREQRKSSSMKALLGRIHTLIQVSSDLATVWLAVSPFLQDAFR